VEKARSGALLFKSASLSFSSEETAGNPEEILPSWKNILLPPKAPGSRRLDMTGGISALGKWKEEHLSWEAAEATLSEALGTTVDKNQLAWTSGDDILGRSVGRVDPQKPLLTNVFVSQ